jgi:hypothetical protein
MDGAQVLLVDMIRRPEGRFHPGRPQRPDDLGRSSSGGHPSALTKPGVRLSPQSGFYLPADGRIPICQRYKRSGSALSAQGGRPRTAPAWGTTARASMICHLPSLVERDDSTSGEAVIRRMSVKNAAVAAFVSTRRDHGKGGYHATQ